MVPEYNYTMMTPKALFYLLRPLYSCDDGKIHYSTLNPEGRGVDPVLAPLVDDWDQNLEALKRGLGFGVTMAPVSPKARVLLRATGAVKFRV